MLRFFLELRADDAVEMLEAVVISTTATAVRNDDQEEEVPLNEKNHAVSDV